jgi:hypothetical protein
MRWIVWIPHRVEVVEVHWQQLHVPVVDRRLGGGGGGHDRTSRSGRITAQVDTAVVFSPRSARTTSAMSRTDSSTR